MAVNVFPSAGVQTPDGMTLVGVLGNNTSIPNAGNSRYINLSMKVNTQYVFRFYRSDTGSNTTFPNIFFYKDSNQTYGQLVSGATISSTSTFPYIDVSIYNTTSDITRVMFNGSQSQVTGFVAIYEATSQIGKPGIFYATDFFSSSSTSSWSTSRRAPTNGFVAQHNGFAYEYFETSSGTRIRRTSDGENYDLISNAQGGSFSGFNTSNRVPRIWYSEDDTNSATTSRVFFSDNNCSSWSTSTINLPSNTYRKATSPGFAKNLNGGNGLLYTFRQHALASWSAYSTNGGTSWVSTDSGPFGYNQGYGSIVIAFDNSILAVADYGTGQYTYNLAYTTNGTTFTYISFWSAGGSPSSWFSEWNGGYQLVESDGRQAYIGAKSAGDGYGPRFGYVVQNANNTISVSLITAPSSDLQILQTKNSWLAYNPSSSDSTYYTSPMVYNTGESLPRSPGTWTQRTMSLASPFGPTSMPRTSSNNFFYHAHKTSTTNTRYKTDAFSAGFTEI